MFVRTCLLAAALCLSAPEHRVPSGYAKLDLSSQQREKLYEIEAEYQPRIRDLEAQLRDLRRERQRAEEAVLTSAQRRQLTATRVEKKKAAKP